MKLDVRKVEALRQPAERSLEHAVRWLAIDCPVIERLSQGPDSGASPPAVVDEYLRHCAQVDLSRRQHVTECAVHDLRCNRANVDQRPQEVRASDSLPTLRRQTLGVGWAMRPNPVELELA